MSDRPAIPIEVSEEVLFEARYCCAVCCAPIAVERCHIVPWSTCKDHRAENLVVLCANCHTRSHSEKWPQSRLKRVNEHPCALERDRMPRMSPEQRVLVEAILSCDPEMLNERARLRFLKMLASYLEIDINDMSIVTIEPCNSTRIVIELPETAGRKLEAGVYQQDSRLREILSSFRGQIVRARLLTGAPDSVNIYEEYEIRYWCNRFGVTPEQLMDAVRKVGKAPAAVECELKRV